MKIKILLLILFLLSNVPLVSQDAIINKIPDKIIKDLNNKFPGWQFPEIQNDIRMFLKNQVAKDAIPEMIIGDFDGNAQTDYAIFIVQNRLKMTKYNYSDYNWHIVAFLKKSDKMDEYDYFDLESGTDSPSDNYLMLFHKGEEDYNYETEKEFIYNNDAIFLGFFEKAGISFIFVNGKFNKLITSD
jgi:hypothetical protein